MSVGRICMREVDVIAPDESAQIAASRMHSRKVGTLVVVDADMEPLGIVTDRDLTVRVLAEGKDGATTSVSDILSGRLKASHEETAIEDALQVMRSGPFRRLPVIDDDGKLAGLLSLDDILELLAEEFASIDRLLKAEEPGELGRV